MNTQTRKIKTSPKPKATEPKGEVKKVERPVAELSGIVTKYAGASAPVRGHGKRLSPIVLDRIPNSFTPRDKALLDALHAANGTKQFKRLDIDAGALSRQIGHGYVAHVGGKLDEREATFSITAKAIKERFAPATVTGSPAK